MREDSLPCQYYAIPFFCLTKALLELQKVFCKLGQLDEMTSLMSIRTNNTKDFL